MVGTIAVVPYEPHLFWTFENGTIPNPNIKTFGFGIFCANWEKPISVVLQILSSLSNSLLFRSNSSSTSIISSASLEVLGFFGSGPSFNIIKAWSSLISWDCLLSFICLLGVRGELVLTRLLLFLGWLIKESSGIAGDTTRLFNLFQFFIWFH